MADITDKETIQQSSTISSLIDICQLMHIEACGIMKRQRRLKKNMERLQSIAMALEEAETKLDELGQKDTVLLKSSGRVDVLWRFHHECHTFVQEWEIKKGTYFYEN